MPLNHNFEQMSSFIIPKTILKITPMIIPVITPMIIPMIIPMTIPIIIPMITPMIITMIIPMAIPIMINSSCIIHQFAIRADLASISVFDFHIGSNWIIFTFKRI